jgi:hypothetical protein
MSNTKRIVLVVVLLVVVGLGSLLAVGLARGQRVRREIEADAERAHVEDMAFKYDQLIESTEGLIASAESRLDEVEASKLRASLAEYKATRAKLNP